MFLFMVGYHFFCGFKCAGYWTSASPGHPIQCLDVFSRIFSALPENSFYRLSLSFYLSLFCLRLTTFFSVQHKPMLFLSKYKSVWNYAIKWKKLCKYCLDRQCVIDKHKLCERRKGGMGMASPRNDVKKENLNDEKYKRKYIKT